MTKKASARRVRFNMHERLLVDVITRQAGSLAKAILEAVMNAVDAGARTCRVHTRPSRVVVADDGRGITKARDIHEFFATFGRPHDADEAKTYGTFRMGRGQLFAYGRNTWRTGPFRMTVDIREEGGGGGLGFHLHSGLPRKKGCTVALRLYEPLLPSEKADLDRTVAEWVKYAPIPVELNGKVVSRDPAGDEWDLVTDEAYMKFRDTGALAVYNLGVHCLDLGSYRYGVGGVVVSRKQLKVNFARNDVQDDCPVWKAVKAAVDGRARADLVKSKALTDAQRRRLARLVAQGEAPEGAAKMPLFTLVTGQHVSAQQLMRRLQQCSNRVTVCAAGDPVGDRVHQSRTAVTVATDTLTRFDLELAELLDAVKKLTGNLYWKPDLLPFEQAAAGLTDRVEIVPEPKTSAVERLWLGLARRNLWTLRDPELTREYPRPSDRHVVVGDSDAFDGWTDGRSYIAIDRKFLARLTLDARGLTDLAQLLLHELCHRGPDTDTHVHDHAFFQEFHDRASPAVGQFVNAALAQLGGVVAGVNRTLTRQALRQQDAAEKARRAFAALLEATAQPTPKPDPEPEE